MQDFKIYLAGGMTGLTLDEQVQWRIACKEWLESKECNFNVRVINPCDYFSLFEKKQQSEHEVKNFDLNHVRTSDLVLVNFNAPKSQGTSIEIFLANLLHIPVIGINERNFEIHPWDLDDVDRMFDNMKDALQYINDFYLI